MKILTIFTILYTILIINLFSSTGVSTIKAGDQLNLTTSQLVSPGGNFTVGFFNTTNYIYVGIWYTNDETFKVWVANQSTPIISSSGVFMIDPDTGKLIIATRGTTLVNISDNQSSLDSNITATLEDTGNFWLKNETDNRTLWQSFDYPTNVLLPGMKLGSDLRTGMNWNLTSCLSNDIADFGVFTLSWEPTDEASKRLMIRRRGQPYWTSGNLNNQKIPYMPALNNPFRKYLYNLSYVYNDEEMCNDPLFQINVIV
ncbi:unnamed protein product [Lactuca virosa]|uniref:Bulb-type lectin domain-containing protein n=1 Tax=Lactuca virosa TaxID=75947 RepID=A0AAU9N2W2_9ASTR|nr:unnamed protein product [Lactuca virosa]